jgi:hypothetical protein
MSGSPRRISPEADKCPYGAVWLARPTIRTKRVHNSAAFFVLFAANDNKESRQSVFLEIRDGVVARHWATAWTKAG